MIYKVIVFGATWCAPCKTTKPAVESACRSAGLPYEYVDVDTEDPRAVNVMSVPTVRAYDDSGIITHEHRGGMNAVQVREFLRSFA